MFIARFVIFDLQESSKYLIAKGRDEEAIQVRHWDATRVANVLIRAQVLQHLASRNGRTITLTLDQLQAVEGGKSYSKRSNWEVVKASFSKISLYVFELGRLYYNILNGNTDHMSSPFLKGSDLL